MHGGSTPAAREKGKQRVAEQKALAKAQRMVALTGEDQDPKDHLLESLYQAAALVSVWGTMVAAIDEKAEEESEGDHGFLRGELGYEEVESDKGFTDTIVTPKDRLMAVNAKGDSQVHPYMERYEAAIERRAKLAKLCLDAGVQERQVQVVEFQVQLASNALEKTLTELGLTGEQKQEARRIYARQLRSGT